MAKQGQDNNIPCYKETSNEDSVPKGSATGQRPESAPQHATVPDEHRISALNVQVSDIDPPKS